MIAIIIGLKVIYSIIIRMFHIDTINIVICLRTADSIVMRIII